MKVIKQLKHLTGRERLRDLGMSREDSGGTLSFVHKYLIKRSNNLFSIVSTGRKRAQTEIPEITAGHSETPFTARMLEHIGQGSCRVLILKPIWTQFWITCFGPALTLEWIISSRPFQPRLF